MMRLFDVYYPPSTYLETIEARHGKEAQELARRRFGAGVEVEEVRTSPGPHANAPQKGLL